MADEARKLIEFLRRKDFLLLKELGQGACGKTVLLHDPILEQDFVCKKYAPVYEPLKNELFSNFVREIKILHLLSHENVVRVFSYFLYPDKLLGYILMEPVDGFDIEEYITAHPEQTDQIFLQVIEGFAHLEKHGVLHRDIRPQNILVSRAGVAKIIDFGFGKRVGSTGDFDKSITLNWWCEPPPDFGEKIYDYATEVYFVGKLFEKIIFEAGIDQFANKNLLARMCSKSREDRIDSFTRVRQELLSGDFASFEFSDDELYAYRNFGHELSAAISKIERGAKYFNDAVELERKLDALYKKVMLEEYLPSNTLIVSCFVNGGYYYQKNEHIAVTALHGFLKLMRSASREKKGVILSNLFTRLDAVERYTQSPSGTDLDDDIPF